MRELILQFLHDSGCFLQEWSREQMQSPPSVEDATEPARKRPILEVNELPQCVVLEHADVASWRTLESRIEAGYFPNFWQVRGSTRWWRARDIYEWDVWIAEQPYRSKYSKWKRWRKEYDSTEIFAIDIDEG